MFVWFLLMTTRFQPLFSGFKLGQPAVTKDRTRVYVIQTVSPHAIYYFARENSWTSKRLTSGIANVTGQNSFLCVR